MLYTTRNSLDKNKQSRYQEIIQTKRNTPGTKKQFREKQIVQKQRQTFIQKEILQAQRNSSDTNKYRTKGEKARQYAQKKEILHTTIHTHT